MCDGQNSQFVCGDLINDAIGESTENVSPTSAAKYCAEQRIGQDEICRSFKLGHKREAKVDVCFQCIERCCVMQLGKRGWSNNNLHFNAARTCASASAIGMI